MRFNLPPSRIIILLIVSSYVVYLGFTSQLNLYIHPRYVIFTFVMSLISLFVTFIDGYFINDYSKKTKHNHKDSKLILIPLYFVIIISIFLPARSLTTATISQRSTDTGSIVSTSESRPIASLFSESSKGLSISDWSRLMESNKDPDFFTNKPAKISGFIYDGDLGNNTILLARFIVTCCAVDAIPVTVAVQIENWSENYNEDKWIEVEGNFKLTQTSIGERLVLIPTNITKIDQPSNSYAN